MRRISTLLALALLPLSAAGPSFAKAPAGGQDGKGIETIDPVKVTQAINAGVEYLKKTPSPGSHHEMANTDELVLLTLIEARVADNDPAVTKLLPGILAAPLERTYKVVLQAMLLEELDRVKYQDRIWQCAQFLVDNQTSTGQWGYGQPTEAVKNVPTGGKTDVASGARPVTPEIAAAIASGERIKPAVVRKLTVHKTKDGAGGGDNSNSQYAALGLRACHDAGIKIPAAVVDLAKKFWYDTQHPATEGGGGGKKINPGVASGPGGATDLPPAAPRGWCYGDTYGVCKGGPAYAAMTAGATGTVVIYDYISGKDWKKNEHVRSGLAWFTKNWSVTENIGPSEVEDGAANSYLYYYLYALERLGMLYDSGKIGGHQWYPEGATVLLGAQQKDGSWSGSRPAQPVWDTCFAILFLKRATRPLVASEATPRK